MITLYDLVFQDDRRPSPFCWRAKFALKHKGLGWRDEPMGFTEKQKIAFAQSQTVPVIHDGPHVVKDSWGDRAASRQCHPEKPLFGRRDIRPISSPRWSTAPCIRHCSRSWSAISTNGCGRSISHISRDSRGKRLGTTEFADFQAKAREKGVAAFRAVLEPARRVLKDQPFLSGEQPAYPDYALAGAFLWARVATPLTLLEADDPVHGVARAHARSVRRHGPPGKDGVRYDAVIFDLLTALIDSWTLWNDVAGSPDDGMTWRRRYLEITYGCGAYRPYETLVREAAATSACRKALAANWSDAGVNLRLGPKHAAF